MADWRSYRKRIEIGSKDFPEDPLGVFSTSVMMTSAVATSMALWPDAVAPAVDPEQIWNNKQWGTTKEKPRTFLEGLRREIGEWHGKILGE